VFVLNIYGPDLRNPDGIERLDKEVEPHVAIYLYTLVGEIIANGSYVREINLGRDCYVFRAMI
jgi:hypothetical protein